MEPLLREQQDLTDLFPLPPLPQLLLALRDRYQRRETSALRGDITSTSFYGAFWAPCKPRAIKADKNLIHYGKRTVLLSCQPFLMGLGGQLPHGTLRSARPPLPLSAVSVRGDGATAPRVPWRFFTRWFPARL